MKTLNNPQLSDFNTIKNCEEKQINSIKYYANFSANGGTTFNSTPYEFSSLSKAIKTIKEITKGNHFKQIGNISFCIVFNENFKEIWSGTITGMAKNFQTVKIN